MSRRAEMPLESSLVDVGRYIAATDPNLFSRIFSDLTKRLQVLRGNGMSEEEAWDWLTQAVAEQRRPSGAQPMLLRLADVEPEEVEWIWPGRIAKGKLTMIVGNPGLGKSWMTVDLAARISSGRPMPDETQGPPRSVLLLSAEDGAADTIRPRLDSAGADTERVHLLEGVRQPDGTARGFNLQTDLAILGAAIETIGEVEAVIVDPISAHLGTLDGHKNTEVRGVLAPLCALADEHGFAIIAVSHLNKARGGLALNRAIGSVAFVAAARLGFAVLQDPEDQDQRLFMPLKSNLGRTSGLAQAFRIQGEPARIVWGELDSRSADEVLHAVESEGHAGGAREEAREFLRDILADGPLPAPKVLAQAKTAGIAKKTLSKALGDLGGKKRKDGFRGGWEWSLPEDGPPDTKVPCPSGGPSSPSSDDSQPCRSTPGGSPR